MTDEPRPAVDALPGLARIAASAAWHTTEWGLRTSLRATRRVARAAMDPGEASALVHDVSHTASAVADLARSVSGGASLPRAIADLGSALEVRADTVAEPGVDGSAGGAEESSQDHPQELLRERGAALLRRSRDVWDTERGHPAYERILSELAPDEARVLLLLLEGGPQPSVDVRTGGPIGMVSSTLIAPGLTMIGARAGCRYLDSVPAYLNNLFRLGLVWFSREAVRDPMDYQVLEAQPDVLAAMHSVKFARVVRRSIHLTPFGEDFCRTCLVDEATAGTEFPQHALPPDTEAGDTPASS